MKKALVAAFLILLRAVKMKKNFIWINSACVALSLAMMLAVIPAPVEANGYPVIRYFTADPITITLGEWADLSWHVEPSDAIIYLETFSSTIHRGAAAVVTMKVRPTETTTYTLRAETWDDDGDVIGTATRTVTVFVDEAPPPDEDNHPPVASFSIIPANPTPDDTMESHNTSTDPDGDALTYEWYIGGELVSSSMDWYYDNPPAGSYTIELVVDDGKGGTDKSTKTITVTGGAAPGANQPPVASFSITPQDPVATDAVEATSTSWDPDGDTLKYSWYFNGEYDSGVGNSPSWRYEMEPRVWVIKLVVDDGKGGTDAYTKTIMVSSGAITNGNISIVDQSGSGSPFLDTGIISFKGNVGGGVPPYLYFWDFGDGTDTGWLEKNKDRVIQASHQYDCPGTYRVRKVVKDSAGAEASGERDIVVSSTFMKRWNPGSGSLDDIYSTISSEPVAGKYPDDFGHYYMKFTCHGVTGGHPPYSYYWDFGDGGNRGSAWSGQENTIVHDYWGLGQYTVTVTVFDSCNSEARSSIPYDVAAAQEEDIKVLVVTSVSKMTAKFGASSWAQIEDRLKQLEWTILDIGSANVNAIDLQIEAKGANNVPKILILGGHDVVPFPILPNPVQDGDTLYTDDVYADFDHDPQTIVDVPIARIPDGGDLGLIFTQLSSSSPPNLGKFALANYRRPAAEAVANIFAASVLWSRPTLYTDLDPGEIMARYNYFMLHGARNNSSVWLGEDWVDKYGNKIPGTQKGDKSQGDKCLYPQAFKVAQANSKGIVLSGCCYGAYVINRSPANSICLRFLKNGARCFIGTTAAGYSWREAMWLEHGTGPFQKMFFTKLLEGKPPLQAFYETKVAYAARATYSSERKMAHHYIYYGRP